MTATNKIERDFDHIATLESAAGHSLSAAERWLLAQAPVGPGLAADLGAGTGAFSRALTARGIDVVALDVSAGMIAAARRGTEPLMMVRADVTRVPLRRGELRCVAAVAVLHHLPDAVTALHDWAELLSPGGVLLVQDVLARPGISNLPTNVLALLAAAPTRLRWLISRRHRELREAYAAHGGGERYLTMTDARTLARDAGLLGAGVREHMGWRYSLVWRKLPSPDTWLGGRNY